MPRTREDILRIAIVPVGDGQWEARSIQTNHFAIGDSEVEAYNLLHATIFAHLTQRANSRLAPIRYKDAEKVYQEATTYWYNKIEGHPIYVRGGHINIKFVLKALVCPNYPGLPDIDNEDLTEVYSGC